MTVTIKVNYKTTFQKKEVKKLRLDRRKKERNALFSFLKAQFIESKIAHCGF